MLGSLRRFSGGLVAPIIAHVLADLAIVVIGDHPRHLGTALVGTARVLAGPRVEGYGTLPATVELATVEFA